jgi:oligopeptide/dipeptide ABC transporter ATP-binding protein
MSNVVSEPLLSVRGLHVRFALLDRELRAVNGVSFQVQRGDSVGIVGESGSGKSVTVRAIMRIIEPPGRVTEGEVLFNGKNLLSLRESEMCNIRGRQIAMIFQDPVMSLDPVQAIGKQMVETIQCHFKLPKREALDRAVKFLQSTSLPAPNRIMSSYPHEMSGGMCQRVSIAIALSCEPALLIADEATSAVDVTIQAQILNLLREIRQESGMAILLISHDLSVISRVCQHTAVMYAGSIVEKGPTRAILTSPQHPYTKGLIGCIPGIEHRLPTPIEGEPPRVDQLIDGCAFAPRCSKATEQCTKVRPSGTYMGPDHLVFCCEA